MRNYKKGATPCYFSGGMVRGPKAPEGMEYKATKSRRQAGKALNTPMPWYTEDLRKPRPQGRTLKKNPQNVGKT